MFMGLLLLLLLASFTEASVLDQVIVREKVVEEFLNSLPQIHDSHFGKRLSEQIIVINEENKNWDKEDLKYVQESLGPRKPIKVTNELFEKLFPESKAKAACILRGTPIDFVLDSKYLIDQDLQNDDFDESIKQLCQKAEIGWISYHPNPPLKLEWIDSKGKAHDQGIIKRLEKNTVWRWSYLGHKFRVSDPENRFPPQDFVVEYDSLFILGKFVSSQDQIAPPEGYLKRIEEMEHERASKVKRIFTTVGFKRIDIPRPLWGFMQAYYFNNRLHGASTEEFSNSFAINWHEKNPTLIVPAWDRKKEWHEMFKPVVENWVNETLEKTDLYGIRTYFDGATLENHVDREDTHAASAIMNLDQVNMREDWLLEIYDVYGKVHNLPMKPGDAMLYESAKCMHGRPLPLQGESYTNIFFHYRPTGQPKWWKEDKKPENYFTKSKDEL